MEQEILNYQTGLKGDGLDAISMPSDNLKAKSSPALLTVIQRLQSAVDRYDKIVTETRGGLQIIKKYEEAIKHSNDELGDPPGSAIEEMDRLLCMLDNLNDRAEINLLHLRGIA